MRFVVVVAVLLFSLAGCVPDGLPVVSSPAPSVSPAPVFASEEEALAAAEEAYVRYQEVVDAAFATQDRSHLAEVASGDALDGALESIARLSNSGEVQTGYAHVALVQITHPGGVLVGDMTDPMQAYGCMDISEVHVVDEHGVQVDPPDRRDVFPMLISFAWDDEGFIVDAADVWDGVDFCV